MKKLISICFLLFFVVIGNAQVNNKTSINELNQDQLNLALKHSSKTIKTGKILTFIGAGAVIVGVVIVSTIPIEDIFKLDNSARTKAVTGEILFIGGCVSAVTGIPVWIVGANKKNKIELELVKFNPKGSASINGIGLKIYF
jgi:hypothetical protein